MYLRIVLFLFSIFLAPDGRSADPHPIDTIDMLNNFSGLPPTRIPCPPHLSCPPPLKDLNHDSSSTFIYRLVHGEQPINKCIKDKTMPPAKELDDFFINILKTSDISRHPFPTSCAPNIEGTPERQSLLVTQYQYYHERLNRGSMQALTALHEIDSILTGRPSMKDISCEKSISLKVQQACQDLKKCPVRSQRDSIVNLILSSLKKRRELEDSKNKIAPKIFRLSKKRNKTEQQKEELEHLRNIKGNLEESINEVNNMIPWVKGRIFKRELAQIERSIQENGNEKSIKKQIESNLIRQSEVNKKELFRQYDQFKEAADCLKGTSPNCDRFARIIQKAPSALPEQNPYEYELPLDIQQAYEQFEVVQCLEQNIESAQTYNAIARGTGEIALGFAIGGFGGVWGLATNAAKLLHRGYRMKGSMSMLGLGTLGVTTYKNFNEFKHKCKEASRHIIGMDTIEPKNMCLPRSYPQNVSQYLSCLTEFVLTAAVVTPAVVGKGVGRIHKMKNPKKMFDLFTFKNKKTPTELQVQQNRELNALIYEFDSKEIEQIRPYLNFVRENNIDPLVLHRALRYTRILSAKKRGAFINHLDEVLKGEKNSANRHVRSFLRQEKRNEQRVTKLEKKYSKKAPKENRQLSAKEAAKLRSHKIDEAWMSCRARNMNPSHQRGAAIYGTITTGMMGVSVASGFTNANWNLPKDAEWFGRLSYELAYAMMYTKVLIKVMKNPSSSFLKRYGQFNLGASIVEGIDTTVYSQFFNVSKDDARDVLNRIKNSPQKKQDMEKLSRYLDETGFVDAFKKSVVNNFRSLFKASENESNHNDDLLPEDLKNLTEKDLNKPEIQDRILELVMKQYYESERGYLSLGAIAGDRFAFNRSWSSLVGIPKNLALAVPIYVSLCMTSVYPIQGLALAAGLQSLNQLTSADTYYKARKKLINQ